MRSRFTVPSLFVLICLAGVPDALRAQTAPDSGADVSNRVALSIGADFVSRYVWRGALLSKAVNVQPAAAVSWRAFELGMWGSYAFDGDYSEQDFYLSYALESAYGAVAFVLNDYFFPSQGGDYARFFNYSGVENGEALGAHTLELATTWTTPRVPLSFMVGWNFYNDPDHSVYGEASFNPSHAGFDFSGFVGMALNDGDYYGANGGQVINAGAIVSREIQVVPGHAITLSAALIRNPHADGPQLVVGLGL